MLHVHRADRADALVAALGDLLAVPPTDPFAPEVVGVPTRGVERWLTQSLSCAVGATSGRGDGIVANVAFPSPREIVDAAVAAACGVDVDADPWAPTRVVWSLLRSSTSTSAIRGWRSSPTTSVTAPRCKTRR